MASLSNVLSIPRGLRLFARKTYPADCLTTDVVGDCVYITSDAVAGKYQVSKVDPSDGEKMPCAGVITSKPTVTTCIVQWLGEIQGIATGLTPRVPVLVGDSGQLSQNPPDPPSGEVRYVQTMGVALSSDVVLLTPEMLMVKRRGQ